MRPTLPSVSSRRVAGLAGLAGLALVACAAAADPPAPASPPVVAPDDLVVLDEHLYVEAAARRRQEVALAPAAVVVLTDEDLRLSPAFSLPDRLRYVPGIDVYQARHGQFDVGLRGYNDLTTPRTLALVDGRSFDFDEMGGLYWVGCLHPTDIARVEIVKGPVSVSYGANGFGGVIAVSGRQVGERPETHVLAELGLDGHREVDATVLCPLETGGLRAYVKASAGGSWRDDLEAVTGLPYVSDRPGARRSGDADLRAGRYQLVTGLHLPQDTDLELECWGFRMPVWDMHDRFSGTTGFGRALEHAARVRIHGPWGEVAWLHGWSEGWWNTQFAVYYPWLDYQYSAAGFRNRRDDLRVQWNPRWGAHEVSLGGEYQAWVSRSNLWTTGGSAGESGTWDEVATRNLAVFAEDQWRCHQQVALSAGVRVDRDNRVGGNFSPRLALNVTPSAVEFYRLSYSHGYRLPAPIESYLQEFYFSSNPDLAAETVDAGELGWQRRFPEAGLQLGADLSCSRSNHRIDLAALDPLTMRYHWQRWLRIPPFGPGPGPAPLPTEQPGPFFEQVNRDNPALLWGAELEVRQRCFTDGADGLELWANATWQRQRFADAIVHFSPGFIDPWFTGRRIFAFYGDLGRDLDGPPPWKVNLGTTWRYRGWTAGAVLRYVDGRDTFSVADNEWMLLPVVRRRHLDRYLCLDLMVARLEETPLGPLRIKAGVLDAGDSGHVEMYPRDRVDLMIDEVATYGARLGRFAGLGLDLVLR